MVAKDYRAFAKEKLAGKWGTMALITLIEGLLLGAISFTFVGEILVAGPLALGIASCHLTVARGGDVKIENMFEGFGNFVSALVLYLINGILIFLWSLLLIVPGIIKAYSYAMSYYVLKDNPEMSANDARKESIRMMHGNKWKLFCLHFSYIGWLLLSVLTLGILMLWVTPYMRVAEAKFYENLKAQDAKPEQKAEEKPEENAQTQEKPEETQVEVIEE